jgi:hypothetical protein
MQIRVRVFNRAVDEQMRPPGPPGPGHRFVFSLDLQLEEVDGVTQNQQRVGTYSGVVTVLRNPKAADNFFARDSYLVQYQSTYKFNAVGPVQAGEITEQGVLYFDSSFTIVGSKEFAITGGTGPYKTARGSITAPGETGGTSNVRLLDIQL